MHALILLVLLALWLAYVVTQEPSVPSSSSATAPAQSKAATAAEGKDKPLLPPPENTHQEPLVKTPRGMPRQFEAKGCGYEGYDGQYNGISSFAQYV